MTAWTIATERPLAFGGWDFTVTDGDLVKVIQCYAGDSHAAWHHGDRLLPLRAVRTSAVTDRKGLRAAVQSFLDRLNADEDAA